MCGPSMHNAAYHQENHMVAELNTSFKGMIDEVIVGFHALVGGQAEAPPVEAVQ